MNAITINFYNKKKYELVEKINDIDEISEAEINELKKRIETENKCTTFFRIQKN